MVSVPLDLDLFLNTEPLQMGSGTVKGVIMWVLCQWWRHGCPTLTEHGVRAMTGFTDMQWQRNKKKLWAV